MIQAHQLPVSRLVEGLCPDQLLRYCKRRGIVSGPNVVLQEKPQRLQVHPAQPLSLKEDPVVVESF
jgi:hypothetical protein